MLCSPSGSEVQRTGHSSIVSSCMLVFDLDAGITVPKPLLGWSSLRLMAFYAVQGGYNAWFRVFDNKLNRRRWGEYAENYTHGADSCGIHASGAGFERSDRIESWSPTPLEFEEI